LFPNAKEAKKGTFSDVLRGRGLRASIQGAALKTRKLLKKFDQNFLFATTRFLITKKDPGGVSSAGL